MTSLLYFGGLLAIESFDVATSKAVTPHAAEAPPALQTQPNKRRMTPLAVVVVKDGEICERAAVGVRKRDDPTPVTTNDLFHIGSCTKSMTATLAALLVEEGKLQWTTIVDFPRFVVSSPLRRTRRGQWSRRSRPT